MTPDPDESAAISRRAVLAGAGAIAAAAMPGLASAAPAAPTLFGANYYDLALAALRGGARPAREKLAPLRDMGLRFVRFAATGFWPKEMAAQWADMDRYFGTLDTIVAAAEDLGLALVPSLVWNAVALSDLEHEPFGRWADAASRTRVAADRFTRAFVQRYRGSRAIMMWEHSNELFDFASIGSDPSRLKVLPSLGTPTARGPADAIGIDQVSAIYRAFGQLVRSIDSTRPISSGASIPAPAHMHHLLGTAGADSPKQFMDAIALASPPPIDVISAHVYPFLERRYFWQEAGYKGGANLSQLLQLVRQAADAQGKDVFVGEFGLLPTGNTAADQATFERVLDGIAAVRARWAAVWVYDETLAPAPDNITLTNGRSWMLKRIAERAG